MGVTNYKWAKARDGAGRSSERPGFGRDDVTHGFCFAALVFLFCLVLAVRGRRRGHLLVALLSWHRSAGSVSAGEKAHVCVCAAAGLLTGFWARVFVLSELPSSL